MKLDYSKINYATTAMVKHKPETKEDEERGYKVGSWGELDCFRCCSCPYDTFSEQEIGIHVFHKHIASMTAPATRPISAILYDGEGALVKDVPNIQPGGEPEAEILEETLLSGLEQVMKEGLIHGKN